MKASVIVSAVRREVISIRLIFVRLVVEKRKGLRSATAAIHSLLSPIHASVYHLKIGRDHLLSTPLDDPPPVPPK